VVLSDMCEPWDMVEGLHKKTLSNPYYRMMNTSGNSFKDHVGSMVSFTFVIHCLMVLFVNAHIYSYRTFVGPLWLSPMTRSRQAATSSANSTKVERIKRSSGL
jgi:hypothetical protein